MTKTGACYDNNDAVDGFSDHVQSYDNQIYGPEREVTES